MAALRLFLSLRDRALGVRGFFDLVPSMSYPVNQTHTLENGVYTSGTAAPAMASGLGSDAGMREAASKRPAAAAGLGDGD
eukprot:scaffold112409_cov60-Phaeocystis_antarctica.AAC.2